MSDTKTAIVTGSTSGIGLGIAEALAATGMNVMLNGFGDAEEIEATRKDIEDRTGAQVGYHGADMTKPVEIAALAAATEQMFGQVDVIVPNAGIQVVSPVEDFPPEKFEMLMAINLHSVFYLTRAVFGGMKARKWGRVINIASAHGLVASPFKSAYVAAKHGVVGLPRPSRWKARNTASPRTRSARVTC